MEFIVQDCVKLTELQRLLLKEALAKNLEISLESYIIDIEDKQCRVIINEKSGEASHG